MGNWIFLVALGILSFVAGVIAILNPFPATLIAVTLAGWALLVIGALQIIEAFRGGRLWTLAIGALALLAGINLLIEPLAGMFSLTFVLAILFVVSGIVKLLAGWRIQDSQYRLVVLISGIVSVVLGFIILSNYPVSAVTSLGILLGVQLISDGISAFSFGWARKNRSGQN